MRIGITPGCPAGIGPEVVARAVADAKLAPSTQLVFLSSARVLMEGARRAGVKARVTAMNSARDAHVVCGTRTVVCAASVDDEAVPAGKPSAAGDAVQRDALVRACTAAQRGELDGIVTGPVRKQALVVDGVHFPGQTEIVHHFLAADGEPPLMVFAGGPFVLALQTVHVALHDVGRHITARALDVALARLREATSGISGKKAPKLVVLGVNPHAGEGGMFGREEIDVVTPACLRAGVPPPVPADGFFADVARGVKPPDGVLAMHHDQGLAPYKLLVGGEGINVTWGVRVPRTSPDHGTAYGIAGKKKASSASMKAAIELCERLARTGKKSSR